MGEKLGNSSQPVPSVRSTGNQRHDPRHTPRTPNASVPATPASARFQCGTRRPAAARAVYGTVLQALHAPSHIQQALGTWVGFHPGCLSIPTCRNTKTLDYNNSCQRKMSKKIPVTWYPFFHPPPAPFTLSRTPHTHTHTHTHKTLLRFSAARSSMQTCSSPPSGPSPQLPRHLCYF
jgi:hypothetical protein